MLCWALASLGWSWAPLGASGHSQYFSTSVGSCRPYAIAEYRRHGRTPTRSQPDLTKQEIGASVLDAFCCLPNA